MTKKDPLYLLKYISDAYVALLAVYLALFADIRHIHNLKITLFYVICGGYVLLTVAWLLITLAAGKAETCELLARLKPTSALQWLMLIYPATLLVSTVLSRYPESWIGVSRHEGWLTAAVYALSFYALAKFAEPKRWMVYALGGAVTVMCTVTFLYAAGAVSAVSLGNKGYIALLLTVAVPCLSVYVLKAREGLRVLLIVPIALSVVLLVRIRVLLGFVGLAAALTAALPYLTGISRRGVKIYFASLPVIALTAVLILYAVPFKEGLPFELHSILHGDVRDTFGSGRIRIWREVLSRIPDNLLLGTGPDTMLYSGIEPTRIYDGNGEWAVRYVDSAHSEPLNVLYHGGIAALAAYLGAVVSFAVSFFKSAKQDLGALMLGAGITGYLAAMLFGVSVPFTAVYFPLCLGLFESIIHRPQRESVPSDKT